MNTTFQKNTVLELDQIAINVRSHRLLRQLLKENSELEEIMRNSSNETEALVGVKYWALQELSPEARAFYEGAKAGRKAFEALAWRDMATIRLLDYVDHAGMEYVDLNLRGQVAINNPIKMIWLAVHHGTGGAKPAFFEDMLQLFRQLSGTITRQLPKLQQLRAWMERFPSGLDPRIVRLREENRDRIIRALIPKIEARQRPDPRYHFKEGMSEAQKFLAVLEWWSEHSFHLKFAARKADEVNEMLGHSLDPDTVKVLHEAEQAGIPIFVNPYYLSLLHVRVPYFAIGADLAIRHYVLYSRELVEEFAHIVAWEKEDLVQPGEPNAAGWILPNEHNIHRRYPEVAILIPDSMGRACAGLCASCQRMYNFQRGHLNFNLKALTPKKRWPERLEELMSYWEEDAQLRDILITGGDALMSADETLKEILNAVYRMAKAKREANINRPDGEKYAELQRVRLGSRIPVYLPQRITPALQRILAEFKHKAAEIGVRQFIIQTHFEAPMEITPEAQQGIERLLEAGWMVSNQHVHTAPASRRGHNAKLRQALNEIGVLPYYTFTVKGYMENHFNFSPNARAVQEQLEEKILGAVPQEEWGRIAGFPDKAEQMRAQIEELRRRRNLPFLATDRNVINLPGVGKSLSFRLIGITRYGRRILEFDHDINRVHSPVIEEMGKLIIIESKSISEYLEQLKEMGEDPADYEGLFGYSMGETELRLPLYEYPSYDFKISEQLSHFSAGSVKKQRA